MTSMYTWRSFQPRLSFPRPFQQSLACFRVTRSPSNSWASCYCVVKLLNCCFCRTKFELKLYKNKTYFLKNTNINIPKKNETVQILGLSTDLCRKTNTKMNFRTKIFLPESRRLWQCRQWFSTQWREIDRFQLRKRLQCAWLRDDWLIYRRDERQLWRQRFASETTPDEDKLHVLAAAGTRELVQRQPLPWRLRTRVTCTQTWPRRVSHSGNNNNIKNSNA